MPVPATWWISPRDGKGSAFEVEAKRATVDSLKKAIKVEKARRLADIDPDELIIYSTESPATPLDAEASLLPGVKYTFEINRAK